MTDSTRSKPLTKLKDNFEVKINPRIWSLRKINDDCWKISDEIAREGKNSLKITIKHGDRREEHPNGQVTEKAELIEKEELWLSLNTNIWYAFSFYFPANFPLVDVNKKLIFAQWKQPKSPFLTSPIFSFRYMGGKLFFYVAYEKHIEKFQQKIDLRGNWHDVMVNFQLNSNRTGFVKAWMDGLVFVNYEGKMGYKNAADFIYFKMGLYRNELAIPQTIFLDRFRRGPDRQSCVE